MPAQRIHDLVHGRRAVTAGTALRLARYFGAEAQFSMNLQSRYAPERAADALQQRIEDEWGRWSPSALAAPALGWRRV